MISPIFETRFGPFHKKKKTLRHGTHIQYYVDTCNNVYIPDKFLNICTMVKCSIFSFCPWSLFSTMWSGIIGKAPNIAHALSGLLQLKTLITKTFDLTSGCKSPWFNCRLFMLFQIMDLRSFRTLLYSRYTIKGSTQQANRQSNRKWKIIDKLRNNHEYAKKLFVVPV